MIGAGKNFTMDAANSGAKFDFHSISGSGNVTVSLGQRASLVVLLLQLLMVRSQLIPLPEPLLI